MAKVWHRCCISAAHMNKYLHHVTKMFVLDGCSLIQFHRCVLYPPTEQGRRIHEDSPLSDARRMLWRARESARCRARDAQGGGAATRCLGHRRTGTGAARRNVQETRALA